MKLVEAALAVRLGSIPPGDQLLRERVRVLHTTGRMHPDLATALGIHVRRSVAAVEPSMRLADQATEVDPAPSAASALPVFCLPHTSFALGNHRATYWTDEVLHALPGLSDPNELVYIPALLADHPPMELNGRTLQLWADGSRLYSHWLMDAFPRVLAITRAGLNPLDFDHVLVPQLNSFHREMLQAIGLHTSNLIEVSAFNFHFHAEELTLPGPLRSPYPHGQPWLYRDYPQLLRLFAAQNGDSDHTPEKIYIPRKQGRRCLLNDAEVEALLRSHSYASVDPEALGPLRSAQVFSQAHTIIAPHGAGLANMIFSTRLRRVIEFMNGVHWNNEYAITASLMGAQHHQIVGVPHTTQPSAGESLSAHAANVADYSLDAGGLEQLQSLLAESAYT